MDRLFGLDTPKSPEGLSLLRSFFDTVSPAIAEQALQDAEIPFLKKERGTAQAVRLITGFQSFGTDLFVRPEDLARASELMEALFDAPAEEDAQ